MSRYWLDWFAEHAMVVGNPNRIANGQKPYISHAECFHDVVRQACDIIRNPNPLALRSANQDQLFLIDKMAPFGNVSFDKPPLAVAVTDAPHPEIFAHDNDVVERAKEVIHAHCSVYLDFADRVFMMPGGVFQVRALFISRSEETIQFSVILTRPGSNKGWLFVWKEGHHARHPTNLLYDDVWAPELWMIADASRPINRRKIEYGAFADVERLVWMSIANWSTLKQHAAPAMPNFVRFPANENQRKVKVEAMAEDVANRDRIGEMPASDSIFDVVVLPALGEERIRQIRNRISGIKYQPRHRRNCAHTVDGFWRMQAYGPGRKLRKKVWIDGFKRGTGPAKPIMNIMPREYRAA